jgi:hypothetical protein
VAILSKFGGISASGPSLLTDDPFVSAASIIYVNSTTGSDSNGGTRRELPKATVFGASGAISVCTDAQPHLIVCEATHRETISSAYTWAKGGLTLISLGSGTSRAQFTSSVAGVAIDATATYVRIENCYFAASTAATTARIRASATSTGMDIRDCYFEVGASDYTDTIYVNAQTNVTVTGCTFKVTATASSGTAQCGLRATGAATNLLVEECTFDGQSYGWTDSALKIDNGSADLFRIRDTTLQGYSFITLSATTTDGYIGGLTCDTTSGWSWVE